MGVSTTCYLNPCLLYTMHIAYFKVSHDLRRASTTFSPYILFSLQDDQDKGIVHRDHTNSYSIPNDIFVIINALQRSIQLFNKAKDLVWSEFLKVIIGN